MSRSSVSPTSAAPDHSPSATTDPPDRTNLVTGILLIAAAMLAATGAAWLSMAFGWPEILDAPGDEGLSAFSAASRAVPTAFYLMLLSSLVLIPAAIYMEQLFGGPSRPATRAVTAFGVLGGFSQILGWVRWPVTVPHLAEAYAAADSASVREAVSASYDVLNRYAGGALGEHLGWLFQGLWGLGIALLLLRLPSTPRWFAWVGLVLTALWLPLVWGSGLFAIEWLAPVGSTISVFWYLWLLALGVLLIVRRGRIAPGD